MVHRGGTLDAQLGGVCQDCEAGLEGGRLVAADASIREDPCCKLQRVGLLGWHCQRVCIACSCCSCEGGCIYLRVARVWTVIRRNQ